MKKTSSYLGQLFVMYGSDKDRHEYTAHYEAAFDKMRESPIELLEVGIGTMIPGAHSSMVGYALEGYRPGGSLRAWRDWFPHAQITGIDVQPDTQFTGEERITTLLGNSTDPLSLERALDAGKTFDIIIDDGSHYDTDQLATLANLWPRVRSGGYYVIEDITSYNRLHTEYRPLLSAMPDCREVLYHEIPGNSSIVFISKM